MQELRFKIALAFRIGLLALSLGAVLVAIFNMNSPAGKIKTQQAINVLFGIEPEKASLTK